MGLEIERKFLVRNKGVLNKNSQRMTIKQGYIKTVGKNVVRIRITDNEAYITLKGENIGCKRLEYEYKIPINDAMDMLNSFCNKPIIEKTRYTLIYNDFEWSIDEFKGENEGLVVAEIEVKDENVKFEKPDWAGEEVTFDKRYLNSNLIENPYKNWK